MSAADTACGISGTLRSLHRICAAQLGLIDLHPLRHTCMKRQRLAGTVFMLSVTQSGNSVVQIGNVRRFHRALPALNGTHFCWTLAFLYVELQYNVSGDTTRRIYISRLLEVPSLATTFQDVYSYMFATPPCFDPCWPSSGGIYS
jgi:hypothetical protein